MRCPKCHYVSFDGQTRCRNCGYDLSLTASPDPDPLDVSTRPGNPGASPLADLSLKPDPPAASSAVVPDTFAPPPSPAERARGEASGHAAGGGPARARQPDADPLDLPLFVSPSATPRPPLAVRRTTGDVPRARPRVTPPGPSQARIDDEPRLDLGQPDRSVASDLFDEVTSDRDDARETARDSRRGAHRDAARDADEPLVADEGIAAPDDEAAAQAGTTAPLGARAVAAIVDLAFLAAIDAVVLHFTLRLTGLTLAGVDRLPIAPLVGFLLLLNGGYLTLFIAASGQTMGKMATGVKVVSLHGDTVPFGHAVLRALLWLLTIVPLGIGALPALLADDRRALHDRLADTRVIKVE